MVISTGITLPAWAWVAALYCRQKSMMFTAWGPSAVPTGGAGVAWPAVSSILMTAATRRRRLGWGGMWWLLLGGSELLDLVEGELDRGLAAEDRHQHLELLLVGVDLGDRAGELGEGAGGHGDRLADLPFDARLELLDRLGLEDLGDFLLGQRGGLGPGADEAGHTGGVADHVPVPKAVAGAGRAGCGLGVGLGLGAHDAPVSRRRWRARPSRTGCRGR